MKSRVSVSDFTPTAQGAMDGFSAGERVGLMLEGPLVALEKAPREVKMQAGEKLTEALRPSRENGGLS